MTNETLLHLITASVSPAVMISGASLLILAFLGRQGLLTGRARELFDKSIYHAELSAKDNDNSQIERSKLYMQQAKAVFDRAKTVRETLVCLFGAIIFFVIASVGLGASVLWPSALIGATLFFVLGVVCLFFAALYGLIGALKSMDALHNEQDETEKLLKKIGKFKYEELENDSATNELDFDEGPKEVSIIELKKALEILKGENRASTSLIQRRLGWGYNRAARVMEELEKRGVVGPADGQKSRVVIRYTL